MSTSVTSGTYPRAALPVQHGPGGLQRSAAAVWQFLVHAGAHRAQPELLRLAQRHQRRDPALAQQLRDAARDLMHG